MCCFHVIDGIFKALADGNGAFGGNEVVISELVGNIGGFVFGVDNRRIRRSKG